MRKPLPVLSIRSNVAFITALSGMRPVVSNTGEMVSSARLAAHQFVPSAATQRSVLISFTKPLILAAPLTFTDFNRVSPIGPARTEAYSISGKRISPAKLALPSTLAATSSRTASLPDSPFSGDARNGTGSGTSKSAASATRSAKAIFFLPKVTKPLAASHASQLVSQRAAAA